MIFDSSSAPHLKPWLVRTLEPICDAEPGALADYILALLKHNVPEADMRKELAVQLDEFLEKECAPFIDTLFTVIRTKSYLPYNTADEPPAPYDSKPQDVGIPIPLDALLTSNGPVSPESRGRKRVNDGDNRDGQRPAKGPRLHEDGHFSRYGDGRGDGRSGGGWGGRGGDGYGDGGLAAMNGFNMMGMGALASAMGMNGMIPMGMGMNGRRPQQAYQPPDQKRGICRDYYNNGYCTRGAMCKYSHGDDAMVPAQLYPMNGAAGMPFMPMFPGATPFGVPGATYDPNEARMDMRPSGGRPQQRAPLLSRTQQEDGRVNHASGELPVIQDLTPSVPRDETKQSDESGSSQAPRQGTPTQPMAVDESGYGMNGFGGMTSMNGEPYPPVNTQMDVDGAGSSGGRPQSGFRGGRGGSRGGRGTFGGEVHNFRPQKRNDKTLVVEKIPEDKLSLEQVNAWFKRFGTVTNVAIDVVGAKALVSFSNHDEAHAAWKSEDAVFNNRFVKVFWHRPLEGHGEAGKRMLAASAPLVANISTKESSKPAAGTSTPNKSVSSSRKTPSATASALAAKQELLEKQIAEQKSLMASLETATPAEKKDIMARLRKLGEEMKTVPTATPPPASSASPAPPSAKKSTLDANEHERKEMEKLDRELEMHNATAEGGEETADILKAKLEKLKAEAASLGISDNTSETPYYGAPYRGFRGRGRGAPRGGYYRGGMRGGPPPRGSMKLDNRPKKLLIKGASEINIQNVRDWYETTGQLESVDNAEGEGLVVSFKSRPAAEQGLAKGTNIPTVGAVQVTWYTGKSSATSTSTSTTKTDVQVATNYTEHDRPRSPELSQSHPHEEEEIVASGWGGGDDEDGMGML